ncbi:MAG TPA: hypothetical protein VN812_12180 [Candidatus Acidoferrales bacterium]|nr:hypothetical protein [Candidatus Acidoferrales bacterium]
MKGGVWPRREIPNILEDVESELPVLATTVLAGSFEQFHELDKHVRPHDRQSRALAEASKLAQRLMKVEAIGPQTAKAIMASMGDQHVYRRGAVMRARSRTPATLERRHGAARVDHPTR